MCDGATRRWGDGANLRNGCFGRKGEAVAAEAGPVDTDTLMHE
ncbi:MAG: hypothetical protein ACYC27_17560 [Armatimonadota bacterium]